MKKKQDDNYICYYKTEKLDNYEFKIDLNIRNYHSSSYILKSFNSVCNIPYKKKNVLSFIYSHLKTHNTEIHEYDVIFKRLVFYRYMNLSEY